MFQQMMYEGYKYYRAIGTQEMKFLDVSVAKIDELHVIAHTTWQATYLKDDQEITIPFNAHYLLQIRQNKPVIFGWITGGEQQLLQEYGII
jgi:hypothetical protein